MNIRTQIKTVGVIGAGTMGSGIAQVFAQSGRKVLLFDAVAGAVDRALAGIGGFLAKSVDKGKISAEDAQRTKDNLKSSAMNDLSQADFVVEAATEKPDLKKEIFVTLEKMLARDVILASNTSSISISELAATTNRPEQFIGMHFFNPVPLMKLVEVVVGLRTSPAVADATVALAKELGKTPLKVKDHPGFVSNRILMPMINEAVACYADGVADAATIDEVMKLGMNHPMGPLALADLIGLDVCLFILEVLHRDLGEDRYRPTPLLRTMVRAGLMGKKSGRGFYDYAK